MALEKKVDVADIFVAVVGERDRATQVDPATWKWPPGAVKIEFHPWTPDGESGTYEDGVLRIFRKDCAHWDESSSAVELARVSPCPLDELITLAHELGHHEAKRVNLPCQPTIDSTIGCATSTLRWYKRWPATGNRRATGAISGRHRRP